MMMSLAQIIYIHIFGCNFRRFIFCALSHNTYLFLRLSPIFLTSILFFAIHIWKCFAFQTRWYKPFCIVSYDVSNFFVLKEIFIECSFLLQHFPKCDASSNTRQCTKNLICLPFTVAVRKNNFLQKRGSEFRQLPFQNLLVECAYCPIYQKSPPVFWHSQQQQYFAHEFSYLFYANSNSEKRTNKSRMDDLFYISTVLQSGWQLFCWLHN